MQYQMSDTLALTLIDYQIPENKNYHRDRCHNTTHYHQNALGRPFWMIWSTKIEGEGARLHDEFEQGGS
jgi:hypothetical protein